MKSYHYEKPSGVNAGKGNVFLGRGKYIKGGVQIVKKDGGENNLHYHSNGDSFWMVLKGRVRSTARTMWSSANTARRKAS